MRVLPFCLLLVSLSSCQVGKSRPDVPPATVDFEDTVYCFNQRSIVTLGGRKGLIDDSGSCILAPEWDTIEFLDDEVALLSRAGLWYLCTRNGRVFAEEMEKEPLESSFWERLSAMQDQDYIYWEKVLDQLELLGASCAASPRRQLDERTIRLHSDLQEMLSGSMGTMTRDQQERLTRLEQDFIAMRRK